MGRPIHTNNSIIKSVQMAKVQHAELNRDEAQRRQFAMTLQQEAAHKEKQVQDSHRAEAPEIQKKPKNKGKRKKRRNKAHKDLAEEQQDSSEENEHIDLKID